MPRTRTEASLEEVIRAATAPVIVRASNLIARAVADMVAAELDVQFRKAAPRARRGFGSRSRTDITKWSADKRARRVPSFVIEATGLDTKKKIVAKYGNGVTFEKGKPLPPIAEKNSSEPKSEVKAKPPTIRKKAKAA